MLRAFGPITGWLGGWGVIFADVLVMASLSQIAGAYTFDLFGMTSQANSKLWVGVAGVIWILLMGLICYVGIEASARTQWGLLGAEIVILVVFSIVALTKVWTGHAPGRRSSLVELAQPVRHLVVRRDEQRAAARDLHLLGLGHRRLGQRGDRGRDRRLRAAPRS